MAFKVNNIFTRTLLFAVLAVVCYLIGWLHGVVAIVALGCVAELFFWGSLFRRKD